MSARRIALVAALGALAASGALGPARRAPAVETRVTRYDDGRVAEERTYAGGKETGVHRGWWPDGRRRFEYAYAGGLLEGRSREWTPEGALYRDQFYARGHEDGPQRLYWPDGRVRASYVVRDARRFGLMGAKGCVGDDTAAARRAVLALPYYDDATLTPRWASSAAELARAPRVGDFRLVDQGGRPVTERDVAGRVYVAAFFYAKCTSLCPTVRGQLARVADAFRADDGMLILSHTVTPEADDAAALAHYARVNGIDGRRWRLLTGARAEIERLARDRYHVELADTTGNTAGALRHTEVLALVDADGHVRGVYHGSLAFEVSRLIEDARRLTRGE